MQLPQVQDQPPVKGLGCSIQVGDMGIFTDNCFAGLPVMAQHRFIRGNHDNPELCRAHPNYLGDYGYLSAQDIFFLSGGWSIDVDFRTPGIDWWRDEELTTQELQSAIDLYEQSKPRIVVSHECPTAVKAATLRAVAHQNRNSWGDKATYHSRTELALQAMFELHQPEVWIYGHYHVRCEIVEQGTRFNCLNEFISGPIKECIMDIPDIQWKTKK